MSKKISDLTAATTPLAGTELVEIVQGGTNKKVASSYLAGAGGGRELLSAARTYYVRTDGGDSNTGLSNTSGGAFLTVQKAIDVASSIDNNGYDITIRIGTGTFTASNTLKTIIGSGKIIIRGDASDLTSTVISTTAGDCFKNSTGYYGAYDLQYMKLQTSTSGDCLSLIGSGVITFGNVAFGACAGTHAIVGVGCFMQANANYTINGSASTHLGAFDAGQIRTQSITVTLSGSPAFSNAFAISGRAGSILANGISYSGSATGKRYDVSLNGIILTAGGANHFPGSIAGVSATGGQYG